MMSFDAVVRLGWAFIRVQSRKLRGRRRQLPQFEAQFAADGILAFAVTDRDVLDGASRCFGCGRCDSFAIARNAYTALDPHGPMAFVLGVSRHSAHHDRAEITDAVDDTLLAELSEVCPVRVPFAPLVGLVRRREHALVTVRNALGQRP